MMKRSISVLILCLLASAVVLMAQPFPERGVCPTAGASGERRHCSGHCEGRHRRGDTECDGDVNRPERWHPDGAD